MSLLLGIDFEHIYHTPAYRALDSSPEILIDLETITERLLDLLDRHNSQATFFVVADLAEEYPELIRRITAAGHEIASHTLSHPSLPSEDRSRKQREIRRSKEILERISGSTVTGFRAPTFQVDDEVYSLLAESGYQYSTSVAPCLPIPGFYSNTYDFTEPTIITTPSDSIDEIPIAVNPLMRLPVSGAWTRLFGRTYTLKSIEVLLERDRPVLTYVHPWEFTALWETPLPFRNRFRTGEWLFETYERLLKTAESITVSEFVASTQPTVEYELGQ